MVAPVTTITIERITRWVETGFQNGRLNVRVVGGAFEPPSVSRVPDVAFGVPQGYTQRKI